MPAFALDADTSVTWECFGFDKPWNGWATPVVDWETAFDLLQHAEWVVRAEGALIHAASDPEVTEDEIVILEPDDEGRYHLRSLGWTLISAETQEAKVLPFRRAVPL